VSVAIRNTWEHFAHGADIGGIIIVAVLLVVLAAMVVYFR
jgi:hypothetical protein